MPRSIPALIFSLLLIILGFICMANPNETMSSLAYFIGALMLLSGIGSLLFGLQNRAQNPMLLLDGLLSSLFGGVLLFGGEEISESFVPLFIALWLIFKGGLWILHALRLRRYGYFGNAFLFCGALGVGLGALFLVFPHILSTLLSFMLGMVLIISGAVGLFIWRGMRRW